ncbi:CD209 antigen-like protein C isoform X11 [Epinephelus fuscoguttatus]|uniref:CD209 antigen-like protein C isoform X9 n=1 Tax=Epinephelus fuscoguttatus TaxID=293821 RepID=UPI0020D119DE|nr:CD209 antigen-like protein C isoform X9 [Epinephelus fuscoguttatus]XP_049458101.1 CD209 antigen-like protein C isoform X11 [Epinephelus fuscoguttatus]
MSADALASPDLSLNVRYTRDVQQNRGEGEEDQVEIVQDEEHHADLQSQKARPRTPKNPAAVKRRSFSVTAVTLAVMYLLILAGLYIRYISVNLEKDELQSRYDQLSNNYSQLQKQISNASVHYSQLQDEVKQLKDKIEGKWCPDGWSRFGCSCYFKSKEEKTWGQSRAGCRQRGADLVIINNKEEQKFVTELNVRGESWIGLRYTWTNTGWKYEWQQQWVDGSPLSQTFWAPGLPTSDIYWNAATCCSDQGQWTQSGYYDKKKCICEKKISRILG